MALLVPGRMNSTYTLSKQIGLRTSLLVTSDFPELHYFNTEEVMAVQLLDVPTVKTFSLQLSKHKHRTIICHLNILNYLSSQEDILVANSEFSVENIRLGLTTCL